MSERRDNPPDEASASRETEEGAFDDLLRSAMQARPQPAAPPDLAMRAMALATADEAVGVGNRARLLAKQRRWGQFASIAAAMLIVATLAVAAYRIRAHSDDTAASTSTSVDASSDQATSSDADSSTSSTTGTIAVVFVAETLLLGIVLISMSRRVPTTPWGAEALAGLW